MALPGMMKFNEPTGMRTSVRISRNTKSKTRAVSSGVGSLETTAARCGVGEATTKPPSIR